MRRRTRLASEAVAVWVIALSLLQPRTAAAADLVVGQVAPLDEAGSPGNQLRQGIALCFEAQNRRGGVHGARLKLVSRHRDRQPEDIVPRTRALIAEVAPVALIGFLGTGPMEALLRSGVLQANGLPVVGIRTGASALREAPASDWLFHTRAGYAAEVAKVLAHMATIGTTRLGLYFEDSAFGSEVRTLVQRQVGPHGVQLLALQAHPTRQADPAAAVASFQRAGVNAVLVAGASEAAADFYRAYRQRGGAGLVVGLSTVEGAQVVQRIGPVVAKGFALVLVAPDPVAGSLPLARDLQAMARQAGAGAPPLTAGLAEGCIAARTLAEALRRAGPAPTPARVRQALEAMNGFDVGGVTIGFTPRDHQGGTYVDIAIIDGRGRLLR